MGLPLAVMDGVEGGPARTCARLGESVALLLFAAPPKTNGDPAGWAAGSFSGESVLLAAPKLNPEFELLPPKLNANGLFSSLTFWFDPPNWNGAGDWLTFDPPKLNAADLLLLPVVFWLSWPNTFAPDELAVLDEDVEAPNTGGFVDPPKLNDDWVVGATGVVGVAPNAKALEAGLVVEEPNIFVEGSLIEFELPNTDFCDY